MPWWGALLIAAIAAAGTHAVLMLAAAVQAWQRTLAFAEAYRQASLDPFNLGLAQAAGFALALLLGLRLYRRGSSTREGLAIRPAHTGVLALAIVAGLALQFPLAELSNLLREIRPLGVEEQLRRRQLITPEGAWDGIAIVFALVLVAPLGEELLFRGLTLSSLRQRYRTSVALVISSVLFGLTHVDPVMMVYASVAGFVLGAVALRTGSSLPPVAMHAAFNAVPVMLPERVLPIRGFNTVSEEVHHLPLPLLVGTGVVAAGALAALMRLSDLEAG